MFKNKALTLQYANAFLCIWITVNIPKITRVLGVMDWCRIVYGCTEHSIKRDTARQALCLLIYCPDCIYSACHADRLSLNNGLIIINTRIEYIRYDEKCPRFEPF